MLSRLRERLHMKRFTLSLLVCLAALSAQGQDSPDIRRAKDSAKAAKPEASKPADQRASIAPQAKRANERDRAIDEFVPSEEIPAEQAVAFPADI
jgi:hypothetical protein